MIRKKGDLLGRPPFFFGVCTILCPISGNEIGLAVTLQIKQRRQITMIDANTGLFLHRRFGVEGNTGPGKRDHLKIIGAIANRDCIINRNALLG